MNRWSKSGVLDRVFELLQSEQIVHIRIEAVKVNNTNIPLGFVWLPRMLKRP